MHILDYGGGVVLRCEVREFLGNCLFPPFELLPSFGVGPVTGGCGIPKRESPRSSAKVGERARSIGANVLRRKGLPIVTRILGCSGSEQRG